MIVAIGSDKGSPGATTLALAMAMVWPGERLVCELDLRGADLPFRLMGADGRHLGPVPSLGTLAVDARPGVPTPPLTRYTQQTVLGVPVIRGEVSTRTASKLVPHLAAIAEVAAAWRGAVIADLGSLQPVNPALAVAKRAHVVLLVVRATTEGLGHLRGRVDELAAYVGDPSRRSNPVGVVVVAPHREEQSAVARTRAVLDSVGSPVPVLGVFRHDPRAAAELWSGPISRRVLRGPIVRSAEELVARIWSQWRDLDASTPRDSTALAQSLGMLERRS